MATMTDSKVLIADTIKPFAPPQVFDGAYTPDQHSRILDVVRREGPWPLIIAQHFDSVEELAATGSGSVQEGTSLDSFVSPTFRGYLAQGGVCLYPEIEDCFLNLGFLNRVRSYWQADYAFADRLLFNINGACDNFDPAHLDATDFRGVNMLNSPTWLMNIMTKSNLFRQWQMKKAQVVTWFYKGQIGGGFTYWPDGIHASPQRLSAPMWNRAVVVENEMMFHRGESNGQPERRHPTGLAFHSLLGADPASDGWLMTTDDKVIDRVEQDEVRFLLHWSAEIYLDRAELKKVQEHTDDLTHDRVFEMMISDLRQRGYSFEAPTDPLHDPEFIRLAIAAYDLGEPKTYPASAPGPRDLRQAA